MAITFNFADETDRRRIEHHLSLLASRTMFDLASLHYLIDRERWKCLDFDIEAGSREELDKLVLEAAAKQSGVLHGSSRSEWMRLVTAHALGRRMIEIPYSARVTIVIAEHEAR